MTRYFDKIDIQNNIYSQEGNVLVPHFNTEKIQFKFYIA